VFQAVKSIVRKELYRGASPIEGESLQQALARYMSSSAQIPAYLRLGVVLDPSGEVRFAGGLIVERLAEETGMPFLDDEAFADRYACIEESDLEVLVRELAEGVLLGEPVQQIWQKPLVWQCRCSAERTESALTIFGRSAIQEMLVEDGQAEIICDFCGHPWVIPGERLQEILNALPG
jgi:molecular chaperone Hsp33